VSRADGGAAGDRLTALLADPDPQIRVSALRGLGPQWRRASAALGDPDPEVRCVAAALLVRNGEAHPARSVLAAAARSGDPDSRCLALAHLDATGLAEVEAALEDGAPRVRRAAAAALARIAPERAWQRVRARRDERLVLEELREAPAHLGPTIRAYADERSAAARRLLRLAESSAVARASEAAAVLTDSLRHAAEREALLALSARRLVRDASRLTDAIVALRSGDGGRRADALELLEAADPAFVRPLLPVWEPAARGRAADGWLEEVLADDDDWLRQCAELVAGGRRDADRLALVVDADQTLVPAHPHLLAEQVRGRRVEGRRRALRAVVELEGMILLSGKVVEQIRQHFAGEKIVNRLVSLFDPDARPIRKGKKPNPNQFGNMTQYTELTANTRRGARGLLVPPKVAVGNVHEDTLLPESVAEVVALDLRPAEAVFDRGFTTKATAAAMTGLGSRIFIAGSARNDGSRRTRRRLASHRVGCEGRIAHLKREYGAGRSRLKGATRARIWAGWAALAYNLDTVARLPVKTSTPST